MLATLTALSINCEIVGTYIVSLWKSMENANAITNHQRVCRVWNEKLIIENLLIKRDTTYE